MLRYSIVFYVTIILSSFLFLTGCASKFELIAPEPPVKYEKLGKVSGSATGSLGVAGTAYYVVPMALNSRVNRAYEDALSKSPGATSLIDVTYEESWFWWILGTARTVTISGEAIKEVK
ncbi:hypothetical protein [Desulfobacter curvatus]|uniref:hypothetical protein n=1 Tax=Desulfobacter curvatus TaxID=2290 RepID=UPI00037DA55D|nr:hypothetical protein [Desulfobacter curvatus]